MNYLHSLAERLHAPQDILNSDNTSFLNNYINEELARRLGVVDAHFARLGFFKTLSKKEPFFDPQVYAIKKSSRRRTKPKQKKSKNKSKKKKKSKSSRVHIAKVDEQSDSDSSESDTSTSLESENSSSSSSESDANINVNITKAKKK